MDPDKKLFRYYLRSYNDAQHDSLTADQGVNLSFTEAKSGKLTEESLESIRAKTSELKLKELEYHICPVVLFELDGERVILPFFIVAKLSEERLIPISQRSPYFVRKYLEPSSKSDVTIGTIGKIDDYVENHPYTVEENWGAAWKYAENMFRQVTGKGFKTLKLPGYQVSDQVCVIPKELVNKSRDIPVLYGDVLKLDKRPKLLREFLSLEDKEKVPVQPATVGAESHLGQMNCQYPLSERQRESLQHLFSLKEGELLAVNGPPGTGKTILIQNVVASLWVKKAIEGKEPPIIFATSANNQAIINVIDSFGKMDQSLPDFDHNWAKWVKKFEGRWIRPLKSYGLYFPSGKWLQKNNDKVDNYQIVTQSSINNMKDLEEMHFPILRKVFLNYCGEAAGRKFQRLNEACEWLHQELVKWHQILLTGIQYAKSWAPYQNELNQLYQGTMAELEKVQSECEEETKRLNEKIEQFKGMKREWNRHCSEEPLLWSLLSFLPAIKERQGRRNENFILDWQEKLPFKVNSYLKKEIQKQFDNYFFQLKQQHREVKDKESSLFEWKNGYKDTKDSLTKWLEKYGIGKNPGNLPDCFTMIMEELDVSLRYLLFCLATHYWEARWLLEMENETGKLPGRLKVESAEQKSRRLRRYAMLTPCFVATFYMIARHLKIDKKWGKSSIKEGEQNYLYEFIDLLIVDEAGQVSPPLAAPVFSLAKKAFIVGDIMQIEPISNITTSVDIGNLLGAKIIKDWGKAAELEEKGLLATSGSVMRIAQRRSKYQKENMFGGMFLNEHRRCVDEIIQYCNDLAYGGSLKPIRGNEYKYQDIPHMGYAHIEGETQEIGGSKFNVMEAAAVAKWISDQKNSILKQAQQDEGEKKELKDLVAVITPFRYQRTLIKEFLKELGVKNITVGTVHELQGAERDIILFSPVDYQSARPFYDNGANMLNVAVSRARESFLVFTNWEKFGNVKQSPSGLLRRYIPHDNKVFERKQEEQKEVNALLEQVARKIGKKNGGKHTIIQHIVNIQHNTGQVNISHDGKLQATQVLNQN
ncbi:MAG: AAA domain-containing protein [Thermoactinomyces sp.]